MKKRCLVCFKVFTPKNYWQKYCSPTCRFIMWGYEKFKELSQKSIEYSGKKRKKKENKSWVK